jgi:GT2 family glycosyltransferase
MAPAFSIIVPVKELNDYVRETVPHIRALDDSDWELFIVTNEDETSDWPEDSRIKMMRSGRVGPAEKRDLAARAAQGRVLVFLDDDSYPAPNLLTIARREFADDEITAIGGPAITPDSDTFKQKVSGAVFLSRFSGGAPERYLPRGEARDVDDWPSVNLMVRREPFLAVNGFDSPYWPGEDTFLCLKLVKAGSRIRYVPDLIVWHHRREGFLRHIRQVGAYGLHRGYFARRMPETSFRVMYFLPTGVLLLAGLTPIGAWLLGTYRLLLVVPWVAYLAAVAVGAAQIGALTGVRIALASAPYILATHFAYGWKFLRGFTMRRELVSRLR